ncbi:hypothetical protein [Dyella flagellata]|uniref:Uncharacterized protein n=1 Tax=Dyella flagellata TaxID=1867833 RepID=A0ABQ5XJ34_9GAMM|nr:hypothetical protein [Dyella flagellata]GLQ90540.1 hypothetical protein GCM10007898_41160 [Dyella flagellata]
MHMPPQRIHPASPRNPLRRLSAELVLIVIAKLVLLSLLGWYVSTHYPHADTRPAAVERLLAPAAHTPSEAKP